jgi:hypothetical protein
MRKKTVYMTDHDDTQYDREGKALENEVREELLVIVEAESERLMKTFLNNYAITELIISHFDEIQNIINKPRTCEEV